MYSLMMTLLGSKHLRVIKKVWSVSGLHVALTSAHVVGYIHLDYNMVVKKLLALI
jgi:hypothetical protein